MGGKAGGIIGLVMALVLVLGLVATPFYLGSLQAPAAALDAQISPGVEQARRAVAALDHEVALLSYIYDEGGNDNELDKQAAFRFEQENPGIFSQAFVRELNTLVTYLEVFEAKDRERGTTVLGKGTIDRLRPKAENIVVDVKPYLAQHKRLTQVAERALNEIRSINVGEYSASNHLDANRVRAIYMIAKARIDSGNASFQRDQANILLAAAQDRAASLARLKSRLIALDAQRPDERIAETSESLDRTRAELSMLKQAAGQLSSVIQTRQSELDRLVSEAAYAQSEMDRLADQQMPYSQFLQRYSELSDTLRSAEARAAALRNGTLRDAQEIAQDTADPSPPEYEGGTPDPGLDTLTFRAAQLAERIASVEAFVESQEKSLAALNDMLTGIQDEASYITDEVQTQSTALSELLESAATSSQAASRLDDAALKSLKDAIAAARNAVSAAKRRAGDAAGASRSGDKVDERLQRVSQDLEAEAFAHTLAAQALFNAAQLRFERMQEIQNRSAAAALIAGLTGSVPPQPAEDVVAIQTDAVNDLAEARKALEQAATLIGRISVRFPSGASATGKNYVWQAQIGIAACHLLHAAIVADDRDASFAQQELAYGILKDVAENREQSPLLTSAIDTLVYLQQSAR